MNLKAGIPEAPIEQMWETHKEHIRLVGPRNRPRYRVIVVGTGLAGASAAASLGRAAETPAPADSTSLSTRPEVGLRDPNTTW